MDVKPTKSEIAAFSSYIYNRENNLDSSYPKKMSPFVEIGRKIGTFFGTP